MDQAQDNVALKVRQLYYDILIAQLKQQAAEEEVAASQVKLQESLDDVEKGKALEVVALDSRASYLDAKQAALTQKLQIHDLTVSLDDLLGLPLETQLVLDADTSAASMPVPSREECIRIAQEHSPEIRAAEQGVVKAESRPGPAAKDAYIPDITGLARYSYQSGVPLLVHNFGTFGVSFTYDLFDGGRRIARSKTREHCCQKLNSTWKRCAMKLPSRWRRLMTRSSSYRISRAFADAALKARTEASRVTDSRFKQNAALASARAEAHAKTVAAKASFLQATLGLSLAQGDLKRTYWLNYSR